MSLFIAEQFRYYILQAKRGIAFIGPKQHAIDVMGDKLASKRTAMGANINIIPGFDGIVKVATCSYLLRWSHCSLLDIIQDADQAIMLAKDIGEHKFS